MNVAASIADFQAMPRMQRARGAGRIAVGQVAGRTRLRTLFQEGCAKIRLPRPSGAAVEAVLINTSGGLTGGDVVEWQAEAQAESKLSITTQACERIYKSSGGAAEVTSRLRVAAGAHLDWLPQETILFGQSCLKRSLEIELEGDATLTALEAVLIGREAMGEAARDACLSDNWRIRRDGRLVHAEATRLTGAGIERDASSLLAGCNAFATLVSIAPDAEARLEKLRPLLATLPHAGASATGERLVLRFLAPSGIALRRSLQPAIAALSGAGAVPRLWTI